MIATYLFKIQFPKVEGQVENVFRHFDIGVEHGRSGQLVLGDATASLRTGRTRGGGQRWWLRRLERAEPIAFLLPDSELGGDGRREKYLRG
jgi:hypothetical protein